MKGLLFFPLFLVTFVMGSTFNDPQHKTRMIELTKVVFDSKVSAVTTDQADHALRIASYILSANEFQDSLIKRDFTYENVCAGGSANKKDKKRRITGAEVLEKLFQKKEASLILHLRNVGTPPVFGWCWGLGHTKPGSDTITSNYKNIKCDMSDIPFEYAYGIHLAHEYMHNIGYCHTDHIDDVAEATGLIAYHLICSWYKDGKRIE